MNTIRKVDYVYPLLLHENVYRQQLWLTMAERHLEQRGVDWKQAEKLCFNEWSNPDDEELGIQIVKVSSHMRLDTAGARV